MTDRFALVLLGAVLGIHFAKEDSWPGVALAVAALLTAAIWSERRGEDT